MEGQIAEAHAHLEGQKRLITNLSGHAKNKAAHVLNDASNHPTQASLMDNVQQESIRNERIAKNVSRSKFMGLGENPPKLASESTHSLLHNNWATFSEKNSNYIEDESIPPACYTLIEQYREKARTMKPGNDLALTIDDFFGQAHDILKDAHLREIARISNEHRV